MKQFVNIIITILICLMLPAGILFSQDVENKYSSLSLDELNEAFLNAVYNEADLEDVKDYLAAGADVNARTDSGITPLRIAVHGRDNLEIIRLLLDAGADVNTGDSSGTRPIMIALMREFNIDVVNLLLDAGADLLAEDERGRIAENFVSYFEGAEVKQLIKKLTRRAEVAESLDIDDYIELFKDEPVIETVRVFLEAGGDPDARNNEGLSPFTMACGLGAGAEIIKLFLSYDAETVQVLQDGWTPILLLVASDIAEWETYKLLIDAGADVNKKNEQGYSTFLYAVAQGMPTDLIGKLIASGADINAADKTGRTAILMAAKGRNPEMVEFLHESGADATIPDGEDRHLWDYIQEYELSYSPELYAQIKTLSGNDDVEFTGKVGAEELFEIMEYVSINPQTIMNYIKSGGDVNLTNDNGDTFLILAGITAENPRVFDLLIEAGADVNALDASRSSALFLAAASQRNTGAVDLLINAGADVNSVNVAGMTPVFAAIYNQSESSDLIRHLIDAGADINIADNNGVTPLILALSRNKSVEIISLLVTEEVVNQPEKNGWTPVMIAAANHSPDMDEIITILLDAGADLAMTNSSGNSASDYLE